MKILLTKFKVKFFFFFLVQNNKDYVFDFYCSKDEKYCSDNSDFNVRLPTDEELHYLFFNNDENSSVDADDINDSNNENYYKNDYPDEDEFTDENDTTSDDECYRINFIFI